MFNFMRPSNSTRIVIYVNISLLIILERRRNEVNIIKSYIII